MTSTSPRQRPVDVLTLRSPDALVASLPHLLGFTPRESAVVVWLRDGAILLAQRLDLPGDPADHMAWLAALGGHPAALEADEMVVVVVTDGATPELLVDRVLQWAKARGIRVRDALRWNGARWWSLLCTDAQCCPDVGRVVAPSVAAAVAAEFTVRGSAPLADRAAVERTLAPDEERVRLVLAALATEKEEPRRPSRPARERWRDTSIERILGRLGSDGTGGLEPSDAARILTGLHDVRVRDTVLWELARLDAEPLMSALRTMSEAVRSAPPGLVAPAATVCAIVAWMAGDGTRAMIATERARADDPAYSLAVLVEASVRSGLPPQAWREATAGLSRSDCRHGARSRRRRAS